jgi:glucokinase
MEIIAADIGGTHISAATITWKDGFAKVNRITQREVDTLQDADHIIHEWAECILPLVDSKAVNYLGISMPGPFDYDNGISLIQTQGKMRSLFGRSVKDLISEKLNIPRENIRITNDAECFLKGEGLVGAGKGYTSLIGLTLGTGLGSAIQIEEVTKDAKLWTAPFRDGIAEDYLGTGWFVSQAKQKFGMEIKGVKELLFDSSSRSNSDEIFNEFGRTLGEFLLPYLLRLKTQQVILGGKVALAHQRFLPATFTYLKNYGVFIPIEISLLGESAALIGASSSYLKKS